MIHHSNQTNKPTEGGPTEAVSSSVPPVQAPSPCLHVGGTLSAPPGPEHSHQASVWGEESQAQLKSPSETSAGAARTASSPGRSGNSGTETGLTSQACPHPLWTQERDAGSCTAGWMQPQSSVGGRLLPPQSQALPPADDRTQEG